MADENSEVEIVIDRSSTEQVPAGPEPIIEIVNSEAEVGASDGGPKDVEKALKKLNKKLEKERKARREAEEKASQAEVRVRVAANEVTDTNLHFVGNIIETVKRDQEILTANLKHAMASGDYDRAAEIQHSMTTNNSKLVDLERGYAEMRAQPRVPVQPPAQKQGEVTVDDLIDRVTPKSAKWLKSNRDNLQSPKSIRIMARAHDDAVDLGITPESDEYFRFVEQRVGIDNGNNQDRYGGDDVMSKASQATGRRSAPPSAPVSRAPLNSPSRPGTIRLTAEQVEAAKISGISPQEYYNNLVRERERNR